MAYVWFGVRGEGKLEALQAVISDGVVSSEVREKGYILHDAFCGVPVPVCCMLCDGMVGGMPVRSRSHPVVFLHHYRVVFVHDMVC